mgnify:CR=1 FL=1
MVSAGVSETDFKGRRNECHLTGGLPHADADRERALRAFFPAPYHTDIARGAPCDACIDIFADGVFQETFRSKNDRLSRGKLLLDGKAGICHIVPVDRTFCTAEVIHMGVAVQHSLDIQRAEAFFHQSFGCLHIFPAHQHVKNDPPLSVRMKVALDISNPRT